jgi:RNA recognition motif-containing protein
VWTRAEPDDEPGLAVNQDDDKEDAFQGMLEAFQREVIDMTKIYVGNLPFSANEGEVRQMFEEFGTVNSVAMINDRETGRPRGFGFVEMPDADAAKAIAALNGKEMGGRALRINEAQERERGGGGGGRRFGGGDRGDRGGYGGGGGGRW